MRFLSLFFLINAVLLPWTVAHTEEERLAGYRARNYSWPITKFQPDNPGWNSVMARRLRQIEEMEDQMHRFEGFAQTLSASLIQRNYTQYGFGLARAPDGLMSALRQGIRDGLAAGPRLELGMEDVVEGDAPWFIDRPDLMKRVLKELQRYPETWVGMELTPHTAYGFRLYRNQSSLYVHVDRSATHIISFILHIDSSDDAEPWPILIEDLQGNTHEVVLTSGDILFYESSKCFHGRPRKFTGSWYSSVFVHYYPKFGYKENFDAMEKVYAIPPHWNKQPTTHSEIPLIMHGTTMSEPTCPNGWCGTQHSMQWSGPGEEGFWIAPTREKFPFDPTQGPPCMDMEEECAEWASWSTNECETNAKYMLQFCPKSCKLCTVDRHDEL